MSLGGNITRLFRSKNDEILICKRGLGEQHTFVASVTKPSNKSKSTHKHLKEGEDGSSLCWDWE